MRAIIAFLIVTLSFLAFASTANAQLLNRLKKKAQEAAEAKVEEKISNEVEKAAERAVEKSWQSIFGEEFGSEGDGINVSFSMNSNAATEDVYSFNVITTMEVESTAGDGESEGPMIMKMHFNEAESYSGTKFSGEQMDDSEGDMFMIYDLKNESMVMLMESEGEKYSFAYDWTQGESLMKEFEKIEAEAEAEYGSDSDDGEVSDSEEETKTDEVPNIEELDTKVIAGYECRGYRTDTDGVTTEYWISEEEDLGVYKMLRINEQTKELRGNVPTDYPYGGMLMEMTQRDQDSGDVTTMRVTDIDKNASVSYTMSDYPPMSFSTQ
jgi:hypothetical protein